MHTDRIHVFDGANDHTVVVLVAHELKLVLLPAENALLEEHLGGWAGLQTCASNAP